MFEKIGDEDHNGATYAGAERWSMLEIFCCGPISFYYLDVL